MPDSALSLRNGDIPEFISSLRKVARHGIGRRIAMYILMFSSVVTLLSTVLQLGLEYQRDIDDIETLLQQIQRSYSGSLAGSLWSTSTKDLELQLNGIMRLPDLIYVEVVSDTNQRIASAGSVQTRGSIDREFPLYFQHRGQQVMIGKVRTVATKDGVYKRLRDKIVVILITQTIKTFLVSLFILLLFQMMVGRHLKKIAIYSDQVSAGESAGRLDLERGATHDDDELDQVVRAFNDMHQRLQDSIRVLQRSEEHTKELLIDTEKARAALHVANETMEEQVRERTAQLEVANKELEAFSYSVSHDLRSPLRGIDGWSLALQEDYGEQLDQTAKQYLDRVRGETQRMGQLIDDMLRFSRFSRLDLSMTRVDITALADAIAVRICEHHPDRQYDIRIQPGMQAWGDARLLDVVLTNLLENASKFTGMRPVAQITVGYQEVLEPQAQVLQMAFFVRDNGAGFDMNYAQKLFGVFQRMHRASEFPGTGIGLATVHRILHRHGGNIWAEAKPDHGACFYFTLASQPEAA
jgi:signal transduction histidine kinase